MSLIEQHAYLLGSFLLVGLWIVLMIARPAELRRALLSGVLAAPFGAAALVFEPEYWQPAKLGNLAVGLEDVLFSCATGGLAWLLATWPWDGSISVRISPGTAAWRYLSISVVGVSLGLVLWHGGLGVMTAALVSITALPAVLICVRPGLWPLVASGCLLFTTAYGLFVQALVALRPDFVLDWNSVPLWGQRIAGVPLGELVWAAAFGAAFPAFMMFVYDGRIRSPRIGRTSRVARGVSRPGS